MEPFFERGDKDEISQAKIIYRRKYKTTWRKEQRKTHKAITTMWNKEEYEMLGSEARHHKLPIARYAKQAVIAYGNKRYIPLHQKEVNKLLQLLAMAYNIVADMEESNIEQNDVTIKTLKIIEQLEKDIRIAVFSPKTIWQILTEFLSSTSCMKTEIIQFLQSQQ